MADKKQNTVVQARLLPPEQITATILAVTPQVGAFFSGTHTDFVSLYIKQRGDYDFILVLKRYASDGGLEVCFGGGASLGSAFKNLEGSVAAAKWRPDRPYDSKKG